MINKISYFFIEYEVARIISIFTLLFSALRTLIAYIGMRKKRLSYYSVITNQHIFEGTFYNEGKSSENVIREFETVLIIFNSGTRTIRREDLTVLNPLLLEARTQDNRIIRVKINRINQIANNFTIKLFNQKTYIDFDFIDPKEGVSLSIFHTLPLSDNFLLNGKIIGLEMINREKINMYTRLFFELSRFSKLGFLYKGLYSIVLLWAITFLLLFAIGFYSAHISEVFLYISIIGIFLPGAITFFMNRRAPKELESVEHYRLW
jgi:hypothetical protein